MNGGEARIFNNRNEIAQVAVMLDRFACAHGLSTAAAHDLHVALDEVVSNVVRHGYPAGEQGEITVRLTLRAGSIVMEIEDRGVAFDPLQAPPPDLGTPLRDRRVGGLGVHFVKHLVDEVSYVRQDGINRLTLVKKL